MFIIEFVGDPQIEFNELAIRGQITLGDFSEIFVAPLVFWTVKDYQKQWREAAERIVNGKPLSCFVTAMRESPDDGPIFLWIAYRLANAVYFQHKLMLPEIIGSKFEPFNLYAQVDERETKDEDGRRISEWQVSVNDIAKFFRVG